MMNSSRNANVISSAPVAPGSFSVSGHDLILDFISPSIASTSTSTSTSSHHNQRRRSSILIPGGNNTNINTNNTEHPNYDSTVMNTDSNTYNSSHDDDNDGVIEIRFSDMPYETEAVINGLILFEEKENEKKKKEKMVTSSSEEDGRATTITATPNAITLTTTTAAAAATEDGNQNQGSTTTTTKSTRSSILRMRTSLMSKQTADSIYEGFTTGVLFDNDAHYSYGGKNNGHNSYSSTEEALLLRSSLMSTASASMSDNTATDVNTNLNATATTIAGKEMTSNNTVIPSTYVDGLLRSSIMSIDSMNHQQHHSFNNYKGIHNHNDNRSNSSDRSSLRFSSICVPDTSVFGTPATGGGGGIDTSAHSLLSQQQQPDRKKTRTFSVCQSTLNLFNEPFMDQIMDFDDDAVVLSPGQQTAKVIKPIEVISNELQRTYLLEHTPPATAIIKSTEEALAAEFEQLNCDEKDKIMFTVHGFDRATGYDIHNDPQIIDEYLKKVDDELVWRWVNHNTTTTTTIDTDTNSNEYYETDPTAFREAQLINPEYVNSRPFRLMFLRMYSRDDYECGNEISQHDTTTNEYPTMHDNQNVHGHNSNACVLFDVPKVVTKILFYFNVKKVTFGLSYDHYDDTQVDTDIPILGRDIRLSDLSEDDREALDSGACQILSERDAAGRVIMIYAPGQRKFKHMDNWCRAFWYIWHCMITNTENQVSGCVNIVHARTYLLNCQQTGIETRGSDAQQLGDRDSFADIRKVVRIKDSMMGDAQMVALHYCYTDSKQNSMVTAQKIHFMNRHQRSHFREHYSTNHQEICFQLETFGIPIDKEIFLPNGHLGLKWYNEWIKCREQQESISSSTDNNNNKNNNYVNNTNNDIDNTPNTTSSVALTPTFDNPVLEVGVVDGAGEGVDAVDVVITIIRKFDVLFGKGKTREHVGNLRCAYLVEQHEAEYENANRKQKTQLATTIVTMVQENNGRFLKKDKEGWKEVEDKQAREKVSHFFRRRREIHAAKGKSTIAINTPTPTATAPIITNTLSQQGKRELPS